MPSCDRMFGTHSIINLIGGGRRTIGTRLMSNKYDVLVVGGGIMGSSTAHWLKSRDKKIKVSSIYFGANIHMICLHLKS